MVESLKEKCSSPGTKIWPWYNVTSDLTNQGGLEHVVWSGKAPSVPPWLFYYQEKPFTVTWSKDRFLLVSMEKDDNDLRRLVRAFSIVVGYEPFCTYKEPYENPPLWTYEWDKVEPEKRFEEIKKEGKLNVKLLEDLEPLAQKMKRLKIESSIEAEKKYKEKLDEIKQELKNPQYFKVLRFLKRHGKEHINAMLGLSVHWWGEARDSMLDVIGSHKGDKQLEALKYLRKVSKYVYRHKTMGRVARLGLDAIKDLAESPNQDEFHRRLGLYCNQKNYPSILEKR
jgi:hypothetical protein